MSGRYRPGTHVTIRDGGMPGFDKSLVGETATVIDRPQLLHLKGWLYKVQLSTGEIEPLYEAELTQAAEGVTA